MARMIKINLIKRKPLRVKQSAPLLDLSNSWYVFAVIAAAAMVLSS